MASNTSTAIRLVPGATYHFGAVEQLAPVAIFEVPELRAGEAALLRIAPLLDALKEPELPRINIEIAPAVIRALGVVPKVAELRPEILVHFPYYDLTLFDAFGDIVLALGYADAKLRAVANGKPTLSAQAKVLKLQRDQLCSIARLLAQFGLLDDRPLQSIGKHPGYQPLISDVATLVQLLDQNWERIEGRSPITRKELRAFDAAVLAFTLALTTEDPRLNLRREPALLRRKVYTLFRRAIIQVRRAVSFLRGRAAVKGILPSFCNSALPATRAKPGLL